MVIPDEGKHGVDGAGGNDGRREAGADADSAEDDAVGLAALGHGEPLLHELACGGIHCGLAGAEREPHEDEEGDCVADGGRDKRGENGEDSPPGYGEGK